MKHTLIILLLVSCSPKFTPNATLTGQAVEVKKDGHNKYTIRLKTGSDTVTVLYGGSRARVGDRFLVEYDTTCIDKGRKAIITNKH